MLEKHIERIFAVSPAIRYVAIYSDGKLASRARTGLANASASESDKYEELIVNPTLLKLLQQRGNIDCGGMEFVVIRYGSFFEFVMPTRSGHLSVGIEADHDPLALADDLRRVAEELKL
jgi:hypothetical protein